MKIEEEKNHNINLELPSFKCDSPLGEVPPPLPFQHFFWCFSGTPGSGKTSQAISLLQTKGKNKAYRGVFSNIIVFMPQTSLNSMSNNIFKSLDKDKKYSTLDPESLEKAIEIIQAYAEDELNSLLFIDDQAPFLKDPDIKQYLNMLVCNRRHYRLSIMLLTQSFLQVPLSPLRKCITHLTMFKPSNKREGMALFEELLFMPKEVYEKVIEYVFGKKHDFMFVDIAMSHIYKNWNRLLISE